MKKYFLFLIFCILTGKLLFGQFNYSGSINIKNQTSFNLVSENDSVSIQISEKQIIVNIASDCLFGIKEIKRNQLLFFSKNDTSQIVQTKTKLTFQPGMFLDFKKRTLKELTLENIDGKIVLNAEFDFRYPVANYRINIHDSGMFKELLSYAAYYLFRNSRKLKNSSEASYLYFVP